MLMTFCCGGALADEFQVLSAGAIEPGLKAAAAAFEKQTGHVAKITFNTAPELRKRMESHPAFDVVQRVSEARVVIAGETAGKIGPGLLVLVCAEYGDSTLQADKLLAKILKLRLFGDDLNKMNRHVQDLDGSGLHGGLLIVSQFTLAADATGGNRPSFTGAAPPAIGRKLYDYFVAKAQAAHSIVQTGQFGADMQLHLVNDGPVTIPLQF